MTPEDYLLMCDAAKAAGYDIWWKNGTCKGGPYMSAFIGDKPWRPLEDDGDAFRLMVRFQFTLDYFPELGEVNVRMPYADDVLTVGHYPSVGDDERAAATRLAILKASAALGKEMRHA